MRWNYKNLFIAFLLIVLAVLGIYFVVEKYVIGTTVTFDESIAVSEEVDLLLISKVSNFDAEGLTTIDLEAYNTIPFVYNEPFGDDISYEVVIPYDFHYVGIRRVSDGFIKYYDGKTVKSIYSDKVFHDVLLAQERVAFELHNKEVDSGYVTYIKAQNVKIPEFLHISAEYSELKFNKYKDMYVAMLPFDFKVESGIKHVRVWYDTYDGPDEKIYDVNVRNRQYSEQRLHIAKNIVQEKKTENARAEHALLMEKIFKKAEYDFDGEVGDVLINYSLPVGGRVTTEYGVTRYVNNELSPYSHVGLDLAQPEGKVIRACKDGKVVCAEPSTLTGNTIVISHGLGFYSVYYHLKRMYVSEGEIVETNNPIGEVGTTGFSTGPHLHFEITYYDKRLEPGNFIFGEAITYDSYKRLFNE